MEEREALDRRYSDMRDDAASRGATGTLDDFETRILDTSRAAVSMGWAFFRDVVLNGILYGTYHRMVRAGLRPAAAPDNDRKRNVVDSWLFRSYRDEILFAALALGDDGLTSYDGGEVIAHLREVAVAKRATLLEENSFPFSEKHDILQPPPAGFRSVWGDRHKLASAKLDGRIGKHTDPAEFEEILLFSEGKRETDEFIEVYVYGSFTVSSLDSVSIAHTPVSAASRIDRRNVLEKLAKHGVTVRLS